MILVFCTVLLISGKAWRPSQSCCQRMFDGDIRMGSTNHKCSEDHFLELGNSRKVGENLIPDHSCARIQRVLTILVCIL